MDGEEQANDAEPRFTRLVMEYARDYAIITLDADGVILSWSVGAERILGYGRSEAVGMSFDVLFVEADRSAGTPTAELRRAMEDGRAEDTRWHVRKDGKRFWANGVTMRVDGEPILLKFMRDETRGKLAEDQRVLLLNELNHRIKNTLSTVQSIADQTLRAAGALREVREALAQRLIALGRAHDVLVAESWAGADLATIVMEAVTPHAVARTGRFQADGPEVRLSAQHAVPMALVVHELTTNAVKYGALSVEAGGVLVTWNLSYDDDGARHLTWLWRESGGPRVSPPTHEGFGTRLLARSFAGVGGTSRVVYDEAGVCCIIEMPLSGPEELPMLDLPRDPSRL